MDGYNASFPAFGGSGGNSVNPYIAGLLPLLTGGAGFFGASGPNTQTNSTTSSSGSASGNSSSSTTPNLSPEQQQIANSFGNGAVNQYNRGTDLTPYKTSTMEGIAEQGQNNAAQIANSLASRGLSYSPAAGTALTQNTLNTGNQQNQFLSSLPLLQHQLDQGNLQQLIQSFSALPTATSTSGSFNQNQNQNSTTNQTSKTTSSPLGGLLSGVGSGLGLLLGAL